MSTLPISNVRSRYDALVGQQTMLQQQSKALNDEHEALTGEITLLEKCGAVVERLTDSARERVARVIGPVCTGALRDVFEPSYALEVTHQQQPSGKYVSRLLATDGVVRGNPMTVRGGSVVGVLSIFLPAAVALLRPDLVQPWFALDEPVGMIGANRLESCAEAVYQLTHDEERPLQVILTTQVGEPWDERADVHIHLTKNAGGEVVVKVTKRISMSEEL